ncbi:TPA_asm: hypothetical protein vir519_00005 [Caudoviricetes sp. vir519]|nr:TPA_asm: hypothetical protein vir519_00005 [Caudoviricetes sp. vir519]
MNENNEIVKERARSRIAGPLMFFLLLLVIAWSLFWIPAAATIISSLLIKHVLHASLMWYVWIIYWIAVFAVTFIISAILGFPLSAPPEWFG